MRSGWALAGEIVLATVLALSAVLLVRDHAADDAATVDEPYHAIAGAENVGDGTYWYNIEHPPLMKLLAGAALLDAGAASPLGGFSVREAPAPRAYQWAYQNRIPAHAMIVAARRPFPWLLALLVLVTWFGGRTFFDPAAGLAAAALVAWDPTMIGHSGLVHTDVGAALTITATVLVAARAAGGSLRLWPVAGLLLGLALATKFSAILAGPAILAFPVIAVWTGSAPSGWRQLLRQYAAAGMALLVAVSVVWAVYSFAMRRMPDDVAVEVVRKYLEGQKASPTVVEAAVRASTFSPRLGHWLGGFAGVSSSSATGRGWNYFRGRISRGSFLLYFPAAYVLKSTPAFLVLLAAGSFLGARRVLSYRTLVFLLPAGLITAAAMRSHYNIGVRHILPVTPLLAIVASGLLSEALGRRWFRYPAAILAASSLASVLLSRPSELSYFNFLAGGQGGYWLSDSNLDWGQDALRLARRLRETGTQGTTTAIIFGGLDFEHYVPDARRLDPARPDAPGRYAISQFMTVLGPQVLSARDEQSQGRALEILLAALRQRGRFVERVGQSITIWELPPGPRTAGLAEVEGTPGNERAPGRSG